VLKEIGRKTRFFGYGCTGVNVIKLTHVMADFMKLEFRRLNDENKNDIRTLRLPDKTLAAINIVLIFSCGSAGQKKCLQIVSGQSHIEGYLHFCLHSPHSALMIQIF
jgi:hypothetical protein